MWPAKLAGEGALLYDACAAMCDVMERVGVAVDGGKDSLSMAARVGGEQTVKAPGTLVVSAYAPCPDITLTVTPDLKCPQGKGGWKRRERILKFSFNCCVKSGTHFVVKYIGNIKPRLCRKRKSGIFRSVKYGIPWKYKVYVGYS